MRPKREKRTRSLSDVGKKIKTYKELMNNETVEGIETPFRPSELTAN